MISVRTAMALMLGTIASLLLALGYVSTWQVRTASLQAEAESRRHESFRLAEAMRQSSNDLTRMVRLYVATGEPRYKAYYDEILAIRNGTAPRPLDYDGSLWDRVLVKGQAALQYGPAKSLEDLMREAKFSDQEFLALNASRRASDALAEIEVQVMARVGERIARGVDERYILDVYPDYQRLTDAAYHGHKDRIMAAVEDFERLVDERTLGEVEALRYQSKRLLSSQISFLLLMMVLSAFAFVVSERGLTRPLRELMQRTRRIATGDYGQRIGRQGLRELDAVGASFNHMAEAIQSDIARREAAEAAAQAAQRVAEAANQAKSDFLANMSHEIRTPLNAVLGMSEMLAETPLDDEQRDFVSTISNSGAHLLGVINDILDFSKIEAGMLDLDSQVFDLRQCVEDALELVAGKATEKQLDLALDFTPDTPEGLRGDPQRVRQILVNLLSNAVKFTEKGEVVVRVSAESLGINRHRFSFEVRDTGIGIPPERMGRLFKSFSQVDSSTTRTYGGTGLGLAICKRLAEMMGGGVGVASVVGQGSTFSFSLVAETNPDWVSNPLGSHVDFEGRRVLIVDDNHTNRRLLRATAEFWGMQVRDTELPVEALEWIARGDLFDLAVLDYLMPEMDGRSLAQAIRRHRDATRLPLIMASSAPMNRRTAPEFAVVLSKPLRRSTLFDAFQETLAGNAMVTPDGLPHEAATAAARSPLRILLAEDNPTNQKITLRMLQSLGYQADLAEDGAKALAAVQAERYDLVLMDVHMPEMDGLEATRRIRQLPPEQQPRIFAMTASVLDSERQECFAAGMERHIAKPVQKHALAIALREVEPRQLRTSSDEPSVSRPMPLLAARPAELLPAAVLSPLSEVQEPPQPRPIEPQPQSVSRLEPPPPAAPQTASPRAPTPPPQRLQMPSSTNLPAASLPPLESPGLSAPSWLVLIVLLLGTALAAWHTHQLIADAQQSRFDAEVRRIEYAVEQRMNSYVQVLRGGQGLFAASDDVSRDDWRRYVAGLELSLDYPGIRTLSFAPRVTRENAAAFIAQVRQGPIPPGLDDPSRIRDFRFRDPPPPIEPVDSPVHAPVLYTEPFVAEKGRALGIDMMRDAGRRAVMEDAAASGEPRLSKRLKILSPGGTQVGFIVYLPLRRDAELLGWLSATFHAQNFMEGLLGADRSTLEFEIFDGAELVDTSRLYSTRGIDANGEPRALTVEGEVPLHSSSLKLAGRLWTLRFLETPGFVSTADRIAPWVTAAIGLLLSLLFYVVARGGRRWQALAAELSAQAAVLEQARVAAESATRAKSDFLANMSHEIRTPLNAIMGMAELMADTRMDEEQRQSLGIIGNSSEHLLGVINDILDLSKIEAGMLELDPRVFDLRRCVEDAMELVAPAAAKKGLDLALDIAPDVPEGLRGDPGRVRQVLVNFLSNAVKFTPQGEVVVRVTVRKLGDAQHEFRFTVRDTGIGIPPERMDRLFKSFSQVDSSTTRHFGGTGLGLAISKRLAEMMGGTAWAESVPGKGSTFGFSITAETHADWVAPAQGSVAEFEGKRLLVVDDNDTNRLLLRATGELWRLQVRDTANPVEALEWIARGDHFDVAVLDYLMPGMDGIKLAEGIRRYRSAAELPLIMASSAMLNRQAAPQFSSVLSKPLRRLALFEAIDRALAGLADPQQPEGAAVAASASPLRILLAEDNETNQRVTLRMLRSMGYHANVVDNGAAAVMACERQRYDLVLMDVHMPEMDGLEATRRIRCLPPEQQPRIFAMTASVLDSERQECLDAGMERHIAKPIQRKLLAAALADVQPRYSSGAPPTTAPAALDSEQALPSPEAARPDVTALPEESDPVHLAAFLDGQIAQLDREGVAELLDSLIDGIDAVESTLQRAVDSADATLLRRTAHSLKANTAMVGAIALSDRCDVLEQRAKRGSTAGCEADAAALARDYRLLIDTLKPLKARYLDAAP